MKPSPTPPLEQHRSAWEASLRQALTTSQTALRHQAFHRAFRHLVHPRLLLETPLLADDHPWKREALAVSDAFEAVTNGMETQGVWEALDALPADSPLADWRHLIVAIRFFYERLDEAVEARLDKIGRDSPLAPLVAVLRLLTGHASPRLGAAAVGLAEAISQPDAEWTRLVQDLAEGLESEDETLFFQALSDWMSTASRLAPSAAQSALIWAWKQLEWRDFDQQVLLELGFSWGPESESYRCAALGCLSWDSAGAALLWLRFLLTATREGSLDEGPEETLAYLEKFRRAAEHEGPPDAVWVATWTSLADAWNQEARLRGWNHRIESVHDSRPQWTASPPASAGEQLSLFSPGEAI